MLSNGGHDHRGTGGWLGAAYDRFGPKLYRYALMILADRQLAEDAVQDAFAKLLARGRVDDVKSAEAYLRTVVRNEAYGILLSRPATRPIEKAPEPLLQSSDVEAGNREERARLEFAMRMLPPEQREVVHLKLYEGMTFGEIGELLRIPQNTAASRYRYAIESLREMLAERKP